MGSSFETKQNVGGGILTGPPGMPLPVGIGSSRLSFTGAPQPGAPYCIPALLQSARSSAAEMFRFPRSPSTDSDDLYPDSSQVDVPRQMAAPGLPPPLSVAPPHATHHRRSRSSMSDEQANRNPAGYHLRGELQQQQPCEYTHCLTWQGGPRRDSNEGTGPVPRVTSHDAPGVTTTGGNATVASVSANPGGLASDNRGSGRLCRSVQDDDVAEGAAPCQRGKPSAEGTERERAASSRSGRKDRTSGRANGKNDSGDREENSTGLGGVGRSVAGSGRRSGRLSRNLGDDEDEDQRSGKSGSGRLRMSLENDDVATGDVMLPRQRGSAGLSSARRNPPTRHAKGGSEGDGKQPDRTTHEGTKTQLVSRRTHPISQGQAKPKSHVQRTLEEEDCEHRSRSPRVSPTGSDCPPSASEPRERSSSRSVGVVPAGSASRSGGSLPRGDGGASGGGDGASIRQGSRLSRSMERDGAVGRAGDDAAGSRQSSRLGRSVEKEGVACQPGSVVGKKSSTQGVRFGDVHGTGVACERGVVGRRGVRGGERGGEHRRGGGGQERRQPVKLCRSLDEDEDKEVDVDSDNGKVSRENGVSSGRRLERNLEEDEDGECTRGAAPRVVCVSVGPSSTPSSSSSTPSSSSSSSAFPASAKSGSCCGSPSTGSVSASAAAASAAVTAAPPAASTAAPASPQLTPSLTSAASDAAAYAIANPPRTDWTRDEIQAIYSSPLLDLIFHGSQVHRAVHGNREVQQCTLLSVKTGGCSEDCSYCAQSSRYDTSLEPAKFMPEDEVISAAKKAKESGSTRFCMGTAWRGATGHTDDFNKVLGYVRTIKDMGMEVCCTLGMLTEQQAVQLKQAGLTAYNHNLDTSREFYPNVISTRTYDDRLQTIAYARNAGISVCSGGIIGMGEAAEDRVGLLYELATMPQHPESVPVNLLVPIPGTPLESQPRVPVWDVLRMIATARIIMPQAMVRMSAGRLGLSVAEQALCFLAGANSIFTGERLLTTANNDKDEDAEMFQLLGLLPKPANLSL
ncbi:unnamed protein product [Closterium sp. NIES-65]|nr:unnamed protein product [Closterium sp. NIES-65]